MSLGMHVSPPSTYTAHDSMGDNTCMRQQLRHYPLPHPHVTAMRNVMFTSIATTHQSHHHHLCH
eukprot:27511-Eustigmatos_ZCMA.PRE.1